MARLIPTTVIASAVTLLTAAAPWEQVTLAVDGASNLTPWIAARDKFVAVVWGATRDGKTDVVAAVSRDGGQTFTKPVRVNTRAGEARLGGELPPRVALGPSRGSADPEVVVLWTARDSATTVKLARSSDGGSSFGPPMPLQGPAAAGDRGWTSLVVDSRGQAHAFWLDHRGLATGHSATGSKRAHATGTAHDPVAMAQRSALYYASAGAAGAAEREVATGVCYCCKTAAAAGPDGTLYAAWRQVYPGNVRDIAFTYSADGARTFAAAGRVSQDDWRIAGCPDDGPAIAVDATGGVHVVWPTVLGTPPQGALFYAVARDGRTFSPRQRIQTLGSPHPTHPQIAIAPDGRLAVAWDERIEGRWVAAMRLARITAGRASNFGPVVALSGGEPGTYPVLSLTHDATLAVWATGGTASTIRLRRLEQQ